MPFRSLSGEYVFDFSIYSSGFVERLYFQAFECTCAVGLCCFLAFGMVCVALRKPWYMSVMWMFDPSNLEHHSTATQ